MASLHRASEHPESRAIMYEGDKYSRRKIGDFCLVLDGLEAAARVPAAVAAVNGGSGPESRLLRTCLTLQVRSLYYLFHMSKELLLRFV
jgi:hypothetical protein